MVPAPFGALGVSSDDLVIRSIVFLPPGTPALAPRSALAEERGGRSSPTSDHCCRHAAARDLGLRLPAPRLGRDCADSGRRTAALRRPARRLGSAARAVGQACGANPIRSSYLSPQGRLRRGLGGFANSTGGFLLDTKRWLLAHEAAPLPLLP